MARYYRRRRYCRFTEENIQHIDYKDIDLLKDFITETGKIMPSRITGNQGPLSTAVDHGHQTRALSGLTAL